MEKNCGIDVHCSNGLDHGEKKKRWKTLEINQQYHVPARLFDDVC